MKTEKFYEQKYQLEQDPWDYSKKAVEILRHEFIVSLALSLKQKFSRILDVGCGKGLLTNQFIGSAAEIYGIDLSETALTKAKNNISGGGTNSNSKIFFAKGNIISTSFADNYFDLILLSDGINEWFGETENRVRALIETFRILTPGGYALISDYQKPKYFDSYIEIIKTCPLKIVRVIPLHDRLCYQFYSWFKAVENIKIIKVLFRNVVLAKILMKISSLFGRKGAKHLFVIVTKNCS